MLGAGKESLLSVALYIVLATRCIQANVVVQSIKLLTPLHSKASFFILGAKSPLKKFKTLQRSDLGHSTATKRILYNIRSEVEYHTGTCITFQRIVEIH